MVRAGQACPAGSLVSSYRGARVPLAAAPGGPPPRPQSNRPCASSRGARLVGVRRSRSPHGPTGPRLRPGAADEGAFLTGPTMPSTGLGRRRPAAPHPAGHRRHRGRVADPLAGADCRQNAPLGGASPRRCGGKVGRRGHRTGGCQAAQQSGGRGAARVASTTRGMATRSAGMVPPESADWGPRAGRMGVRGGPLRAAGAGLGEDQQRGGALDRVGGGGRPRGLGSGDEQVDPAGAVLSSIAWDMMSVSSGRARPTSNCRSLSRCGGGPMAMKRPRDEARSRLMLTGIAIYSPYDAAIVDLKRSTVRNYDSKAHRQNRDTAANCRGYPKPPGLTVRACRRRPLQLERRSRAAGARAGEAPPGASRVAGQSGRSDVSFLCGGEAVPSASKSPGRGIKDAWKVGGRAADRVPGPQGRGAG